METTTAHARVPNAWGGHDISGHNGMARLTWEDGVAHIYCFNEYRNLLWSASFNGGVPEEVITETFTRAFQQIA